MAHDPSAPSVPAVGVGEPLAPAPPAIVEPVAEEDPGRSYICGDCGADVVLNQEAPVMCRSCQCRILYKTRTTRVTQFIAR